jgi:hypothetical protein
MAFKPELEQATIYYVGFHIDRQCWKIALSHPLLDAVHPFNHSPEIQIERYGQDLGTTRDGPHFSQTYQSYLEVEDLTSYRREHSGPYRSELPSFYNGPTIIGTPGPSK